MVRSSFNIQYQSTGIGSLSSLDEIELKRSVRGLFLSTYGTFRWTCLWRARILAKNESYRARNLAISHSKLSTNAKLKEPNENYWQWHGMENLASPLLRLQKSNSNTNWISGTRIIQGMYWCNSYEIVWIGSFFYIRTMWRKWNFFIHSDRCDVGMDIKLFNIF